MRYGSDQRAYVRSSVSVAARCGVDAAAFRTEPGYVIFKRVLISMEEGICYILWVIARNVAVDCLL